MKKTFPMDKDDTYGSVLRESMKRSMEKPAGLPRPHHERVDPDRVFLAACLTLGLIATIFVVSCLLSTRGAHP
jgi:hypothetical protein